MSKKLQNEIIQKVKNNEIWFCPRLFDHIYTNVDGEYAVCCIGAIQNINSAEVSFKDWYTSDDLNELRHDMLSGSKNTKMMKKHCYNCLHYEKNYGWSERIKFNDNLLNGSDQDQIKWRKGVFDQVIDYLATGEYEFKNRILILQIRVHGNECNLDCYMCHPHNSNTRMKMAEKWKYGADTPARTGLESFSRPSLLATVKLQQKQDYTKLEEQILELLPYTRKWFIQGGEPLVMKKAYKFLDRIVESGHASEIDLELNTNMTKIRDKNFSFLKYIDKFRRTSINMSIDGYGQYNEIIRRRSKWEDIEHNVQKVIDKRDYYTREGQPYKIIPGVFATISLLSILRIDELIHWAHDKGLDFTPFMVEEPPALSAHHLPKKVKEHLLKKYENNSLIPQSIIRSLKMDGNEEMFKHAMAYIDLQCRAYNYALDVYEIYPELDPEFYGEYE